ncbi:unnamed protein product [Arctogadus glacialis]
MDSSLVTWLTDRPTDSLAHQQGSGSSLGTTEAPLDAAPRIVLVERRRGRWVLDEFRAVREAVKRGSGIGAWVQLGREEQHWAWPTWECRALPGHPNRGPGSGFMKQGMAPPLGG